MAQKPNFLIFCTDQMHGRSLGCAGNPDVRTPNLDRLAEAGTRFSRAYCPNPLCTPSRASLITGLTPRQHGALTNGTPLPEHIPTVTAALAAAGYHTHSVGKLHLQPWMGYGPHRANPDLPFSWEDEVRWNEGEITRLPSPYYGFASTDFVGGHVEYVHGQYANWLRREHPGAIEGYRPERAEGAVAGRNDCWRLGIDADLHYNRWIADRTIDYLAARPPGEPFFVWCSFPDPHFPFAAPRPYSRMYDPASLALSPTWQQAEDPTAFLAEFRRSYAGGTGVTEPDLREIVAQTYGMITHVDAEIGRVLRRLERSGLAENTVVAFLADHGEYLGAHHLLYKSVWPYEELLGVPLIWRAPGGRAGQAPEEAVSLLDFAATVVDYAGLDASWFDLRVYGQADRPTLPGRSLRACIDAGQPVAADRPVLVEFDEDGRPGPMTRMRTIIRGRHKLTIYAAQPDGLLFDLDADPNETMNLWADAGRRDLRADLLAELARELARTDRLDAPRWGGA